MRSFFVHEYCMKNRLCTWNTDAFGGNFVNEYCMKYIFFLWKTDAPGDNFIDEYERECEIPMPLSVKSKVQNDLFISYPMPFKLWCLKLILM